MELNGNVHPFSMALLNVPLFSSTSYLQLLNMVIFHSRKLTDCNRQKPPMLEGLWNLQRQFSGLVYG